ncbi:MAG TPA: hypothetical protein VHW90_04745 [Stellaceae bacterium]|nr:hypothetical protein [Stellaceae bacterium]
MTSVPSDYTAQVARRTRWINGEIRFEPSAADEHDGVRVTKIQRASGENSDFEPVNRVDYINYNEVSAEEITSSSYNGNQLGNRIGTFIVQSIRLIILSVCALRIVVTGPDIDSILGGVIMMVVIVMPLWLHVWSGVTQATEKDILGPQDDALQPVRQVYRTVRADYRRPGWPR